MILRHDLDLPAALAEVFPGKQIDLSVAHFDSYPIRWVKHPPPLPPLRWHIRFRTKMLAHRLGGFKV